MPSLMGLFPRRDGKGLQDRDYEEREWIGFVLPPLLTPGVLSDYWQNIRPGQWTRVHVKPRKSIYIPVGDTSFISRLSPLRITHMADGSKIVDNWLEPVTHTCSFVCETHFKEVAFAKANANFVYYLDIVLSLSQPFGTSSSEPLAVTRKGAMPAPRGASGLSGTYVPDHALDINYAENLDTECVESCTNV
eukprot:1926586-Amphidinium_carterae.3